MFIQIVQNTRIFPLGPVRAPSGPRPGPDRDPSGPRATHVWHANTLLPCAFRLAIRMCSWIVFYVETDKYFDTTTHPKVCTMDPMAGPRRKMKSQLPPFPLSSMLSGGCRIENKYINIEERVQGWKKLGVAISFSFAGCHF